MTGQQWEVPCQTGAGLPATVTVFVHGDRIMLVTPRQWSLTAADAERLDTVLRSAAVEASNAG